MDMNIKGGDKPLSSYFPNLTGVNKITAFRKAIDARINRIMYRVHHGEWVNKTVVRQLSGRLEGLEKWVKFIGDDIRTKSTGELHKKFLSVKTAILEMREICHRLKTKRGKDQDREIGRLDKEFGALLASMDKTEATAQRQLIVSLGELIIEAYDHPEKFYTLKEQCEEILKELGTPVLERDREMVSNLILHMKKIEDGLVAAAPEPPASTPKPTGAAALEPQPDLKPASSASPSIAPKRAIAPKRIAGKQPKQAIVVTLPSSPSLSPAEAMLSPSPPSPSPPRVTQPPVSEPAPPQAAAVSPAEYLHKMTEPEKDKVIRVLNRHLAHDLDANFDDNFFDEPLPFNFDENPESSASVPQERVKDIQITGALHDKISFICESESIADAVAGVLKIDAGSNVIEMSLSKASEFLVYCGVKPQDFERVGNKTEEPADLPAVEEPLQVVYEIEKEFVGKFAVLKHDIESVLWIIDAIPTLKGQLVSELTTQGIHVPNHLEQVMKAMDRKDIDQREFGKRVIDSIESSIVKAGVGVKQDDVGLFQFKLNTLSEAEDNQIRTLTEAYDRMIDSYEKTRGVEEQ